MPNFKKTAAGFLVLTLAVWTAGAAGTDADTTKNNNPVSILSTGALELLSNRHTHPDDPEPVYSSLTADGYETAGENDIFTLWLNKDEDALRVAVKDSGYIWGSIDRGAAEGLNKTWSDFANSMVSIEYFDEKNTEKRIGISNSGCKTTYKVNNGVITGTADFTSLKLSFSFTVTVEAEGLSFSVDSKDIKETGKNSLKSVYFMPFLGTVKADDMPGYMFVPDGSGALIRFSKPTRYLNGYEQRVYGKNFGIDALEEAQDLQTSRPNDFSIEEKQIMLPVYGMVNGIRQNAYYASIGEGAEFAVILANPAGMTIDFNWVTARFDLRQKYLQPTQKNGGGVLLPEKELNNTKCKTTFYFLTGEQADYSGMAVDYRTRLEKDGILTGAEKKDVNLPARIDFLGADLQKSFLFPKTETFTTADDVYSMIDTLHGMNVPNVTAVLKGFYKKGLNGAKTGENRLEGSVISSASYQRLFELQSQSGSQLYLYSNPVTGNESQINVNNHAGQTVSKAHIKIRRNNNTLLFKDTYYVKSPLIPEYMKSTAATALPHLSAAFDGIGSRLYSDYTRDRALPRNEAVKEIKAALGSLTGIENKAVYGGNLYLANETDAFFGIPIVNSQHLFENDSVPFLQIVYKGHVDMYTDYINTGSLSKGRILKMIELGQYPSYIITKASGTALKDTQLEDYFSTCFDDWKDNIAEISSFVSGALTPFEGAKIMKHQALETGLIRITYDNGKSLLVNYNREEKNVEGTVVPPEGYTVKG